MTIRARLDRLVRREACRTCVGTGRCPACNGTAIEPPEGSRPRVDTGPGDRLTAMLDQIAANDAEVAQIIAAEDEYGHLRPGGA